MNYDLTNEGDIANYLGISVVKREDGKISLKQKILIENILDTVGLAMDSLPVDTPTTYPPIGKYPLNDRHRKR